MRIAISPCPNDTWIFGAWVLGLVPGPEGRFVWHDVQQLNEMAQRGDFDIIKVSAAQAVRLPNVHILPAGGAFGQEHGPKLVTRTPRPRQVRRIAVPGLDTTAYHLARAALGWEFEAIPTLFSDIPRAVQEGQVDAGILIHETALRFTSLGLELLLDLGQWWQEYSGGLPLPLGVIIAHSRLGEAACRHVTTTIQDSLHYARSHPETVLPLVRGFAQELDAPTLAHHIAAYAGELSLHMGETGRAALDLLAHQGMPA
jgi:1,4-dihydroxy-6-naphthoate synthase